MDEIQKFLAILPESFQELVEDRDNLTEVVLDLGRSAMLRYTTYTLKLTDVIVSEELIQYVIDHVGSFGSDNRAGIEGTLHRISKILNRNGKVIGLTCRIGRVFEGTVELVKDLVLTGDSLLVVGRPGRGKTTILRSIARFLAEDQNKNVVIVDSSNEIAGDGDIPHPAVGDSRRMQVPSRNSQHDVMVEAVQNHTPDVIIVDEIGTSQEADAARTIAQRGVQLVATAHGDELRDLTENPPLKSLVGGVKSVTVSDAKAERDGTNKLVTQREFKPVFKVLVELKSFDEVCVYYDVLEAIDCILKGGTCRPERRRIVNGKILVLETWKISMPTLESLPDKKRDVTRDNGLKQGRLKTVRRNR